MENMKQLPYSAFIIALLFPIAISTAFRATVETKNENNAPTGAIEKYIVNNKHSVVTWKGSMQFASNAEHVGYVKIAKGELMMQKDRLVGGSVDVDMKSITHKDHGSENGLINHLKSPDFFDIENFPIAAFEITHVASDSGENSSIKGNLTIKGVTHAVTFPAKIESKNEILNASGKLTIDRTQWGIRYRSGKFFDNLADETISDSIEFDMKIVANRNVILDK
jgi:polyisoprenoid-binding protein YceI